jgi:hypothetical protein
MFVWEDMPNNDNKERPMRHILDHVPALVKTYGKWPSYLVLLLATAQATAALALVIVLHHLLR